MATQVESYTGLSQSGTGCGQAGTVSWMVTNGGMDVLKMIAAMSDAQADAAQAFFGMIGKVSSVADDDLSDAGGAVEAPVVRSDVSVNSSASSARARARAKARARKQAATAAAERVQSEVTYSESVDGRPPSDGQCYLRIIAPDFQDRAMVQLGCFPSFDKLLRVPAAWLVPGWRGNLVSRPHPGVYHIDGVGMVGLGACLASVAEQGTFPQHSIGGLVSSGDWGVTAVLRDKRPALEDVLGAGCSAPVAALVTAGVVAAACLDWQDIIKRGVDSAAIRMAGRVDLSQAVREVVGPAEMLGFYRPMAQKRLSDGSVVVMGLLMKQHVGEHLKAGVVEASGLPSWVPGEVFFHRSSDGVGVARMPDSKLTLPMSGELAGTYVYHKVSGFIPGLRHNDHIHVVA